MEEIVHLFRAHECLLLEPNPFEIVRLALTKEDQTQLGYDFERLLLRSFLEKKLKDFDNNLDKVYAEAKVSKDPTLLYFGALFGQADCQAQLAFLNGNWSDAARPRQEKGCDIKECKKWAERSAAQGCVRGQLALGLWHLCNGDKKKGIDLITPLAEAGDPEAQSALGIWRRGTKWLKLAAEKGNENALLELYIRRPKERLYWIHKGIEFKQASAYCEMGIYARRELENESLALEWFEKAITAGYETAAIVRDNPDIPPLEPDFVSDDEE